MIRSLLSRLARALSPRPAPPAIASTLAVPRAPATPTRAEVDVVRARADLAQAHVRQRERKAIERRARALAGRLAGPACGRPTDGQLAARDELADLERRLQATHDARTSITRLCQLVAWHRGRVHVLRVRLPSGSTSARDARDQAHELDQAGYFDDYRKDVGAVQ